MLSVIMLSFIMLSFTVVSDVTKWRYSVLLYRMSWRQPGLLSDRKIVNTISIMPQAKEFTSRTLAREATDNKFHTCIQY
jgi:hypothetical protein